MAQTTCPPGSPRATLQRFLPPLSNAPTYRAAAEDQAYWCAKSGLKRWVVELKLFLCLPAFALCKWLYDRSSACWRCGPKQSPCGPALVVGAHVQATT